MVVPEHIVFCRRHEKSAWDFVSVGEGVGNADRCFLQPLPAETNATFRTLIRDEKTKDVLVTVVEFDHALVHWERTQTDATWGRTVLNCRVERERLLCFSGWRQRVAWIRLQLTPLNLWNCGVCFMATSLMFISAHVRTGLSCAVSKTDDKQIILSLNTHTHTVYTDKNNKHKDDPVLLVLFEHYIY